MSLAADWKRTDQRIAFISIIDGPWGGSEELWSRTALELVSQGVTVAASVNKWSPPHPRVLKLIEGGVNVWFRPKPYPLWKEARRALVGRQKSPEGLPLAVVEAMLCGRPVVATDVAGHSEIIKDGVTGFLADAPTADSMAQALERFWARRTTAQMMGEVFGERR